MTKQALHLFVFLLAFLFMASCNNDLFIERLQLSPERTELDKECRTTRIGIAGKEWYLKEIIYEEGGNIFSSNSMQDGKLRRIETDCSRLDITTRNDCIEVELIYYYGDSPATLYLTVTDGYQYEKETLTIQPTDDYVIEIKDISYILYSWSGYPNEDYTDNYITYNYPQGYRGDELFSFSKVDKLPVVYQFTSWRSDEWFVKRLLDSHIEVPMPSYTHYASPNDFWSLTGEKAPLNGNLSYFKTTYVPPMPAPVELPANTPVSVTLQCQYEAVGLECTIQAVNPVTGQTEEIPCQLKMYQPVQFNTIVEKL